MQSLDFVYHILVSDVAGDKDSSATDPNRERQLQDDCQVIVSFIWNILKQGYCSDDQSRPVVDLDFRTVTFKNIEYKLFTIIDEDDFGVVDEMISKIGRSLYGGPYSAKFEEVDDMVHDIRGVVDKAFRSGLRRKKLDVMVTIKNQVGLPVDEYEAALREN